MKPIVLAVAAVALLAACGGAPAKQVPTVGVASQADAAKLATTTGDVLKGAPADGTLTASVGGGAGTLNATLTYRCATSGTLTIKVAATHTTAGATSITEDVTAADCVKANAYELDGHVTYTATLDLSQLGSGKTTAGVTLDGTMAVVRYSPAGVVTQSATVSFNALTWQVASQVTVQPSGGCFSATATASGSLTIGGVTYTPTGSEFAGAWGSFQTGTACP